MYRLGWPDVPCDKPIKPRIRRDHVSCGVVMKDANDRICVVRQVKSNMFSLPKGGMNTGETPRETAIRECFEETGIQLTEDEIRGAKIWVSPDTGYHYFFITLNRDFVPTKQPDDEIAEVRWVHLSELSSCKPSNVDLTKLTKCPIVQAYMLRAR